MPPIILMALIVGGVGIYQMQQIIGFLHDRAGIAPYCINGHPNICDLYPKRFFTMAAAVIISLLLSLAVLLFLQTKTKPIERKRITKIYIVIFTIILVVHLSGLLIYLLLGY